MTMNDGGPAFPHDADYVRGDKTSDSVVFETDFHAGMSLLDYYAGQGAGPLGYPADEELWSYFRASCDTVLSAVHEYDAYMVRRDWCYADAMLAERERRLKESNE